MRATTRHLGLIALAAFCGAGGPPTRAGGPPMTFPATTLPATTIPAIPFAPTIDLDRSRGLVRDLVDVDAAKRERARSELLSLRRRDLAILREAVVTLLPLNSEQVRVLEDVVTHVYLVDEPYETKNAAGFLGISIENMVRVRGVELVTDAPEGSQPAGDQPPIPDPAQENEWPKGIVVVDPTPGLASYQYLEVGDVIVGVDDRTVLRSRSDFQSAVGTKIGGQSVVLHVIRRGKPRDIRVVLSSRPKFLEDDNPGAPSRLSFQSERSRIAADYWEATFVPLISPPEPDSASPATRPVEAPAR